LDPDVVAARYDTRWLEGWLERNAMRLAAQMTKEAVST